MNPFKLEGISPNGKPAHVWGCGICLHVCLNEEMAGRCCTCSYCGEPVDGDEKAKRLTYHRECQRRTFAQQDADRMDKAEKLESWSEGVFWGDDYYASLDDAIEAMDCDDIEDMPEYIYVAKPVGPLQLDAEDILQNLAENYCCEDYEIDFEGDKEFAAACEAFNELNKGIKLFEEDRKRAVKVPKPGRPMIFLVGDDFRFQIRDSRVGD